MFAFLSEQDEEVPSRDELCTQLLRKWDNIVVVLILSRVLVLNSMKKKPGDVNTWRDLFFS